MRASACWGVSVGGFRPPACDYVRFRRFTIDVLAVSSKEFRLMRLRSARPAARSRSSGSLLHHPAYSIAVNTWVPSGWSGCSMLIGASNSGAEILTHVNSLLFAADENRDRPFRGMRDFGRLRQRQRDVGIGLGRRFGFIGATGSLGGFASVRIAGRLDRFDGRSHRPQRSDHVGGRSVVWSASDSLCGLEKLGRCRRGCYGRSRSERCRRLGIGRLFPVHEQMRIGKFPPAAARGGQ